MRINLKAHPTIIALLCSGIIISNALYIFITSIYPLISNEHISSSLSSPSFYLNIISQEIFAYSLLSLGLALLGRSRGVWIATLVNLGLILISNIWLHTIYHSNLLIIINIVLLLVNFRYFNKPFYLSSGLAFAIEFVIFALCYGVFWQLFTPR